MIDIAHLRELLDSYERLYERCTRLESIMETEERDLTRLPR